MLQISEIIRDSQNDVPIHNILVHPSILIYKNIKCNKR